MDDGSQDDSSQTHSTSMLLMFLHFDRVAYHTRISPAVVLLTTTASK
jgi:hypothetical protein